MKGQKLIIILAFVIIIVSLVTILAVSMTNNDLQNTPTDYASFFTGVVVGFAVVGSAAGFLIYILNKVRKKKKQ